VGEKFEEGVEGVLFLVDTGAYSLIIPPSLAKGLSNRDTCQDGASAGGREESGGRGLLSMLQAYV